MLFVGLRLALQAPKTLYFCLPAILPALPETATTVGN
jgi:hypothetical protein